MEFGCENCGCSAVTLPEELVDGALVRCNRCRRVFCTWAEFKEQTQRVLMERERDDEPAVPTNGTDLPDEPRVLAFDPFSAHEPGPKRQIVAITSRFGFTTGQSRGSGSPSWDGSCRVEGPRDGEAVYRQRAP